MRPLPSVRGSRQSAQVFCVVYVDSVLDGGHTEEGMRDAHVRSDPFVCATSAESVATRRNGMSGDPDESKGLQYRHRDSHMSQAYITHKQLRKNKGNGSQRLPQLRPKDSPKGLLTLDRTARLPTGSTAKLVLPSSSAPCAPSPPSLQLELCLSALGSAQHRLFGLISHSVCGPCSGLAERMVGVTRPRRAESETRRGEEVYSANVEVQILEHFLIEHSFGKDVVDRFVE